MHEADKLSDQRLPLSCQSVTRSMPPTTCGYSLKAELHTRFQVSHHEATQLAR